MSNILYLSSDEIKRPDDTTAYAALDVVGMNVAVVGATNATPIVIEHGATGEYATGQIVQIASVGGNTAANGTWKITVVDDTHFSLDESQGNGAYTSGGTISRWFQHRGLARLGGRGKIQSAKLWKSGEGVTNAQFQLIFLKGASADNLPMDATLDNAHIDALWTNRATVLGLSPVLTMVAAGSTTDEGAFVDTHNLGIMYDLEGNDTHIYVGILAKAAYTPAYGETFRVEVGVEKD